MPKGRYFVFEPFRLDVLDERLWECDGASDWVTRRSPYFSAL
jgi:hypothetical protein